MEKEKLEKTKENLRKRFLDLIELEESFKKQVKEKQDELNAARQELDGVYRNFFDEFEEMKTECPELYNSGWQHDSRECAFKFLYKGKIVKICCRYQYESIQNKISVVEEGLNLM